MQFIGILAPRKKEASLKRNLENTLKNIEEENFQILIITIQNICLLYTSDAADE